MQKDFEDLKREKKDSEEKYLQFSPMDEEAWQWWWWWQIWLSLRLRSTPKRLVAKVMFKA